MNNYIKIVLCSLLILICWIVVVNLKKSQGSNNINNALVIGIIQTASHPALDNACKGFMLSLKDKLGEKVEFVIQNAEGSISNAHAIAERFHINNNIKAIYAIATPAAQAIVSVEKRKPIVVAAVTDLNTLGGNLNVCGISDMIDMHAEIDMLSKILPHAQNVAIFYNNAEANSLSQSQAIKKELSNININFIDICVSHENDIIPALDNACNRADVIICPTDNTMAAAMSLIASRALFNKKPLIACYNQAVEQGALASRGVDYEESGKLAGDIMHDILVGHKDVQQACSEKLNSGKLYDKIYVNRDTLDTLGLSLPESIIKDVNLI